MDNFLSIILAILCSYPLFYIASKTYYFVKRRSLKEIYVFDTNNRPLSSKNNIDSRSIATWSAKCGPERLFTKCTTSLPSESIVETQQHSTNETLICPIDDNDNRSPLYSTNESFGCAVRYITAWIYLSELPALDSLSNNASEHLSNEITAKDILLELFSYHRTSRLLVILKYIYENSTTIDAGKLADSMAKLMLIVMQIPINIKVNKGSPFCNILSVITNSFLLSPYPFLCDYILYFLTNKKIGEMALYSNADDAKSYFLNKNKLNMTPSFIEIFSRNIFLVPIAKFKNISSIYTIGSFCFSFHRDTTSNILDFENDTHSLLFSRQAALTLDKIYFLLSEILSLCSNFSTFELTPQVIKTFSILFADSISNINNTKLTTNLLAKSKHTKSFTLHPNTNNSKKSFNTCLPKKKNKMSNNTIRENDDDAVIEEVYPIINNILPMSFDNPSSLKNGYLKLKEKLKALLFDKDIEVFNRFYVLFLLGRTSQDEMLHMNKVQDAYKALVCIFKQMESCIGELELEFLLDQTCKIVAAYKDEADFNFKAITNVVGGVTLTPKNVSILRNSINQCVHMALSFENVFGTYLESSDIFSNKGQYYKAKVNRLCEACYEYSDQMKTIDQVLNKKD